MAIKLALAGGMPPVLMAAMRSAGAAVLVAGWIAWREGPAGLRAVGSPATLLPGLLLGTNFALEFLLFYPGIARTTASRAVLFMYIAPFFTALGAHLFLPDERLRPRQVAGLVVAFAGVAIAFADGLSGGAHLLGDSMCAATGVLWGMGTVFIKANRALRVVPSSRILLFQIGVSAPLMLLVAAVVGDLPSRLKFSAMAWLSLGFQIVVVTFASYLAWFWMLMRYQAAAVASFTFLVPLFGITAGVVVLGEPATPGLLLGFAAVAMGMRLVRLGG